MIQARVLETNIRFDLPGGGLRSEGRVLRLRQDTEARLTYKEPGKSEQGVVNRTEIEFVVDDFEKARLFLEALGYQKLLVYEKYRTTYTLESDSLLSAVHEQAHGLQNCHIMLDELPYGNFVEIEGETPQSIRAAADLLHLNWEKAVPASYQALFLQLCEKHPELDRQTLSFAALEGLNITVEELSIHAADR